jgi:hypothetical protein
MSTAGSVGFLLIFAVVNYTGFKLSNEIGGKKSILLLGAIFCFVAMIALLVQRFSVSKSDVFIALGIIIIIIIIICFAMEYFHKNMEHKN